MRAKPNGQVGNVTEGGGYTNGTKCLMGVRLDGRLVTVEKTVGEHDDDLKKLNGLASKVLVVMAGIGLLGSVIGSIVGGLVVALIKGLGA